MNGNGRIPIPWSQRWRWVRLHVLPVLAFAVCVVGTAILWRSVGGAPNALGEVFAMRIDLTSQVDGLLAETPYHRLQLFDRLEAGDVVMRLDDRALQAALATLGKSLEQVRAELGKVEEQLRLDEAARAVDRVAEARRRAVRIEQVRLAALQTKALIETDKIELERLTEEANILRLAYERNAINRIDFINAQLRRDTTAQRIKSTEKVLEESNEQLTRAMAQMNEFSAAQLAEAAKMLAPARTAIDVQQARIRELELQARALEIRAPVSGTIAAILRYPGQAVRAGDPVVTLAAEQGQYIVGYIRQQQRWQPVAGTLVEVRPRSQGARRFEAVVDRVGPQVELVPLHQLRDPKIPEWGLPVRVAANNLAEIRPGELVDLVFRPGDKLPLPAQKE